jgi:alkylhydroperoxidase family enzyme
MREALAALHPPDAVRPRLRQDGDRPKALNALGTLAHHPALTRAFHSFNGHIIYSSTITERQRELLVLRVATLRHADYEWAQHVVLAADVGLTEDEIRRIAEDPTSAEWAPLERALLAAVDELLGDAVVSDATWAALAAELDEQQLMDVVFTVGAYDLVAMAFKTFGVEVDDDLKNWKP